MVVVWLLLFLFVGDLDIFFVVWVWKVKEEDTEGFVVIVWFLNFMFSSLYIYNMGNLKYFIFRSALIVFKMNLLKFI